MKTTNLQPNFLRLALALAMLLGASKSHAEPSLNETVRWLGQKLVGLSASWTSVTTCRNTGNSSMTSTRTIRSFSVTDGTVHLSWLNQIVMSDEGPGQPALQRVDFDLAKAYSNCRVKRLEIQPVQNSRCSTSAAQVPYDVWVTAPGGKGFDIWVDDEELANRIAKALQHLVELSGGQKEPF